MRYGLADHAQACYGGSVGKSMKAVELAVFQQVKSARCLLFATETDGYEELRCFRSVLGPLIALHGLSRTSVRRVIVVALNAERLTAAFKLAIRAY